MRVSRPSRIPRAGSEAWVTPLPGSAGVSTHPIWIYRAAPLDTPFHLGLVVGTAVQAPCPDRFQYRLGALVIFRICAEAVGPQGATFCLTEPDFLSRFAAAIQAKSPQCPQGWEGLRRVDPILRPRIAISICHDLSLIRPYEGGQLPEPHSVIPWPPGGFTPPPGRAVYTFSTMTAFTWAKATSAYRSLQMVCLGV
jgi:hypothetical protein